MFSLCYYIFCLGDAFLLKKVLQTNGCARRAPKNMLMKIKDKSERFIIISCSRFIFYFPTVLVQTHLQKKRVLHFVYKLSIDIRYTGRCISNQMLKLKLQFYIIYKCST